MATTHQWTLYVGHVDPAHPFALRDTPVFSTTDATKAIATYEYTMRNAGKGEIVTLYRNGIPTRRIQIK